MLAEQIMKNNVLILVVFWAFTGCGIKGDPLPPSVEETVQKQQPIDSPTQPPVVISPPTKAPLKKKVIKKTSDQ